MIGVDVVFQRRERRENVSARRVERRRVERDETTASSHRLKKTRRPIDCSFFFFATACLSPSLGPAFVYLSPSWRRCCTRGRPSCEGGVDKEAASAFFLSLSLLLASFNRERLERVNRGGRENRNNSQTSAFFLPAAMASGALSLSSSSRSSSCAAASTSSRATASSLCSPAVPRRPRLVGLTLLSSSSRRRRRRSENDTAFDVVVVGAIGSDGENDGKAPASPPSSSSGSPPLRRSGSDPMAEAAYEGWAVSSVGGGNGNGNGNDDGGDGKKNSKKKKTSTSSSSVASEWGTQALSNGQLVDALYEDDGSPELVAQNVLAVSLALLLAASLGGVLVRIGAVAVALVVAAVRYSVVAVLLLLVAVVLTPKR